MIELKVVLSQYNKGIEYLKKKNYNLEYLNSFLSLILILAVNLGKDPVNKTEYLLLLRIYVEEEDFYY
jgi:hypothetical protein